MFEQIALNYKFTDLEPHIDAATMEVHYTGHHATYTKVLNELSDKVPALKEKSLEEVLIKLKELGLELNHSEE